MNSHSDSLRGYGAPIHKKYNYRCQYCGYDGADFRNWLQLTVDHIVPVSQGGTHKPSNLITVCHACNSMTSRMKFSGEISRKKIIELKKEKVRDRQNDYREFWTKHVR